MILYQFSISHYCEKARWALDYKGLAYEIKNLLAGFHYFQTKKIAPNSSVPILANGTEVIQGSSRIIDYLDENYPRHPLTPTDPQLACEVDEWERYLDKELGENIRRIYYFYTLDNQSIATTGFLKGSKFYLRPIFLAFFPILKRAMKKSMDITPERTEQSRIALAAAFDRLEKILANQNFILGEHFSRVDLTACALLGMVCKSDQHSDQSPMPGGESLSLFWRDFQDRPLSNWVRDIYARYRAPAESAN